MKKLKNDFTLIDSIIKNNTTRKFNIQDDNEYYSVIFIAKPLNKRTFFNRLKHAYNLLLNRCDVVYYFEDIQKYYPKKSLKYLDYKKQV